MSAHDPRRPSWTCFGCGGAWPCPTRQRQLHAEYAGNALSLAMYLGHCFMEASKDLPAVAAGDLHRRFFGWLSLR